MTASKRVMVAMSGGVDSSVAALLLRGDGCDVCGATCKMYGSNVLGDEWEGHDAWLDNIDDAKRVCRSLGIEHYTFNVKSTFEKYVIERFVRDYLSGRTPNPCVACNRFVKFDAMQRRRAELGFDFLATGHYARIAFDEPSSRWRLLRAEDTAKDQTYFLATLTQDQLAHTLFPLGDVPKSEVRKLAERAGFPNSHKPESQDICFIPSGDYRAFIQDWTRRHPVSPSPCEQVETPDCDDAAHAQPCFDHGPIESTAGRILGEHTGLVNYTIGQRKGIGVAANEPLYVIAKDSARNALVVGTRAELMARNVEAVDANFVSIAPEDATGRKLRVKAKTSYRQEPRDATATFNGGGTLHVIFDDPIVRPAAGQAVVLYDADTANTVLAGATIA